MIRGFRRKPVLRLVSATSIATSAASRRIAKRLVLHCNLTGEPAGGLAALSGAEDAARRGKATVPASIAFQSKPEIAREQITAARDEGLEPGVVLADGHSGPFRDGLTALGLDYIVGVQGNALAWLKGKAPDAGRKPGRSPKGSERGVEKPRSFRARQGAPWRPV